MRWWADYVGIRFKAFGSIYKCVEYDGRKGLCMELVGEPDPHFKRAVGDTTWVSERAVGRTYYPESEWR